MIARDVIRDKRYTPCMKLKSFNGRFNAFVYARIPFCCHDNVADKLVLGDTASTADKTEMRKRFIEILDVA